MSEQQARMDAMADALIPHEAAKVRVARKDHHCAGQHDGQARRRCGFPIKRGESYLEWMDDAPAYSSGSRYHWFCAASQGVAAFRAVPALRGEK